MNAQSIQSAVAKLVAAFGLTGALVIASPADAAKPMQSFRGFVSEETLPGLFTFRPCQGAQLVAKPLLVNDFSEKQTLFAAIAEVRKARSEQGQALYVEFLGDADAKTVNTRRFQRAVGHIDSCAAAQRDAASSAKLFAEGLNPTWRFSLSPAGARLEVLGSKPLRFPAHAFARPARDGTRSVYDAWSQQDGGSIRIEFFEELCVDGGAEAAFGARAVARVGSKTYEGCAARF